MKSVPDISIVIPARNEAARLPRTLLEVKHFLDQWTRTAEVIVAVGPSEDGTVEVAQGLAVDDKRIRILALPEARGKGYAVRCGMTAATGTLAHLFMDADLSVPVSFVETFVQEMERDRAVEILIGSRRHRDSKVPRPQPLARRIAGRMFNWAIRGAGITKFKDTQCGFKALRADVARQLFPLIAIDGFAFDVELLWRAERMGIRIRELPVIWNDAPDTSLRFFRDGLGALWEALSVRRLHED